MKIDSLRVKIVSLLQQFDVSDESKRCATFIRLLDELIESTDKSDAVKMTQLTIMLEGFYRSLSTESKLKNELIAIRNERWGTHYGTPTITFLLTYENQIEQTKRLLEQGEITSIDGKPWEISANVSSVYDPQNILIVDDTTPASVAMPANTEVTGQFIKTHNPTGGFTTTPCDPVSQKFIEYASTISKSGGVVLEIGAAFGAATLEAIAEGATVFCNDIDPKNLAVISNRLRLKSANNQKTVTGDIDKLVLVPGSFPDELSGLPNNFFDGILICRVMHFFTGEQIEKSLKLLAAKLKTGGKLFVVCETPYLKNWQKFIPEFENRISNGMKWPGEINDPANYESSGRAATLPAFVHWITKDVLERSLNDADFYTEFLSYINRAGQFPNDLLLDGRESIGAIATKRI